MQTFLTKMILEVGDYHYLPQNWFLNYHGKVLYCKFVALLCSSVFRFLKKAFRKCIERWLSKEIERIFGRIRHKQLW